MNARLWNFTRGLFVFSNEDKDRWHFVNVHYEGGEDRRSLQRRITIGPEERHRTSSERIAKLKLNADAARMSALEIQNVHNDAFDVEQVTKKFFDDYTNVYFDFQDDLTEQTGDRRWAHDYSLQFVNRMMFLYFVQRKRWLGDDPEFMKGFWNVDPYTGQTLSDSSEVDIDHVVPLANAWRSGASSTFWSTADREEYANDPEVLLSADDAANQIKGDKGPEAWKPPNREYWCEYARRCIWIKSDWQLTINPAEESALRQMLGTCGGD